MDYGVENIQNKLQPLRNNLLNHALYAQIQTIEDLRIFMEHHVYAVWDFMSLLKSLQSNLTCTTAPWFPKGNAETRYLINEIVVAEESDLGPDGVRKSHFELYLDAMKQCGADTASILTFLKKLEETQSLQAAFEAANTPLAARAFVNFTFKIINSGKVWNQAAIFTFGREDLIPGMFLSMLDNIPLSDDNSISLFKYYLERHIEIDGDHHSHLAIDMTKQLCNTPEKWQEAETVILQALAFRKQLWDGVLGDVLSKKMIIHEYL